MADVKISELTTNASPVADDIAAVSKSDASATNKVTLQKIAQLFSDNTGITGADRVTNIVSLTQAEYDALTPDASTLYVIIG